MSDVVVSIQAVTHRFRGMARPALDGLEAAVYAGQVTGLVGPDGAGKTTLLRLVAGLLEPTQGAITACGFDTVKETDPLHHELGYMPQRFGLYEDLTVMENLSLYADLRGVKDQARKETLDRLLDFTDLAAFTGRLAGRLSGGMKQKLGLACALIKKPRLLLLDEPSVGVDPISRRELWRMVQSLISENVAVVWSTAYLDEAEQCHHVLLLNQGKLLFSGEPQTLTDRVSARTFQLRGLPEPHKRSVLQEALRQPSVLDGVVQGRAVRLVLRDRFEPVAPLSLSAYPEARWVAVPPRFEDAFLDILGGGPGGDSSLAARFEPIKHDGRPVVEAQGLTKRFGAFTAVRDNSFSIQRGEIFGLLGPNGAGKTTTFKMMCGLLKPTEGQGFVAGLDLRHSASEARARLGYMAQKFSLYGDLSVRQNLEFFSGVYGLRRSQRLAAIECMIDVFDLAAYLGSSARDLPLGFKQRLALACAVMHQPDVLFLDEPTSGVDPITRREFWNHINGLVDKGITVLITTHFMDEAEYCDRIGLIYRGEKIAEGSPDALKDSVRSSELTEPTLEDAFIALIGQWDSQRQHVTGGGQVA